MKTHTLWPMILRKQKIYCKDIENELKSDHNKIEWLNFVLFSGILKTVDVGQYLMTKDTE